MPDDVGQRTDEARSQEAQEGLIMSKQMTVPVSERGLIRRINRRLSHSGERLKTSRSGRGMTDLGQYFILNVTHNVVVMHHVDPEAIGRKIGVSAGWESVVKEKDE